MSVKVHVLSSLRMYTDDQETIEVEGTTVGECLMELSDMYPDMGDEILYPDGKLNEEYEIWINAESAHPNELAWEVKDGDDVYITLRQSGG